MNHIKSIRKSHIGRSFHELDRYYKERTLAYIHQHGFPELTTGYLSVLSQIDFEGGTEMRVLLDRLRSSKQGVSRTVATCEDLGFVKKISDPLDQRALKICFTNKGARLMETAVASIAEAENEMKKILGDSKFNKLKAALAEAAKILELIEVDN